jgi:putative spermidine/putrescine transport system permease protein
MTAHAWRSPCLLLAAPVLFFAAFFLAPLAVVALASATRGPHGRSPTAHP